MAQYDEMQRLVVDIVSRVQFERMVRAIDAARIVLACVLVKPAGQPVPPLNNMVVRW